MINGASSLNQAGNANISGFSFGYSGNTTSFGGNTTGFGTQNTGGAFGQNNATTASFGASNNTSAFGGSSNTTSFGFGQGNNTTFGGTAAFGQATQGSGNQNNTSTGTAMFGGGNTSSTGMFGGGQTNSTGMFGGGQTNNSFGAATSGSAFGAFSPAKPATTSTAGGFSFGQNTGGGFSFGSNLGNQPQAGGGGMFSNLGGTGGGGLFSNLGNQNTAPATNTATGFGSTGMFGGAAQTNGSMFGGASIGTMFGGSNQANASGSMFGGSSLGATVGGAIYGAMTQQPQQAGGFLPPQMLSLSNYTLDEPSNPFSELLKNAEKNLGNKSRLE